MSNSLYSIKAGAFCPACLAKGFRYRNDSPQHFTLHIPRDRWPASMSEPRKPRVVVNGLVLDADDPRAHVSEYEAVSEGAAPGSTTLPDEQGAGVAVASETAPRFVCDCGEWSGDSPQGYAAHRRKAKQHQAVTA